MNDKGFFVTFEGGEGAGKTTLIKKLSKYLSEKNKSILCTFEPGGTDFGKSIRSTLLDVNSQIPAESELFLYLADRAYHVENKILPALSQGKVVFCDRFTDSSIAYQGAGREFVSLERIESMSLVATKGLTPDLTFFLDISPEIALLRLKGKKDRLEREDISFHKKVRTAYLSLAMDNPQRVVVLNAENSIETVFEEAKKKLDSVLENFNLITLNS